MTNLSAWPSMPASSAQADNGGQDAARSGVLAWFIAQPWLNLRPREPGPQGDVLSAAPSRSASARDPRTGRFRRAPEQPPAPEIDDVLTLADAVDRAGPATGGPVRTSGRDHTGEQLRNARPAPRPAEAAHVREIAFCPAPRVIPCADPRRGRSVWRRANGR